MDSKRTNVERCYFCEGESHPAEQRLHLECRQRMEADCESEAASRDTSRREDVDLRHASDAA